MHTSTTSNQGFNKIAVALAVVGILSIGWLVKSHFFKISFPLLPEGFYWGHISAFKEGDTTKQDLLVYSKDLGQDSSQISLSILGSSWENVTTALAGVKSNRGLRFTKDDKKLVLWGHKDKDNYSGSFSHSDLKSNSSWSLEPIKVLEANNTNFSPADLQHTLLLRVELHTVITELQTVRQNLRVVLGQKAELSDFITNPEKLREHAEQRFNAAQQQINQLSSKVAGQLEEVKKMEQQVALAYRVTQRGTLVSLARESLERESRWVESMFRSEASGNRQDLTQAAVQAEKIAELRRQINNERNLLLQLRVAEEYAY